MNSDSFGLLGKLSSFVGPLMEFFSSVYEVLVEKTVKQLITDMGLNGAFVDTLLPDAIGDLRFGVFILGSGLIVYLAYQLVKWILDVVF